MTTMAADNTLSELAEKESGGTMKTSCPLYGCKRVYSDMSDLDTHIKDHDSPAQSLPGKVLLCSAVGCGSSFPNMKKLMEHMRHHHKPNIYFLCESCRTKLRSYRGLLTHLHTCSKVPRGKPKVTDTVAPSVNTGSNPNPTPVATNQNLTQLESTSTPEEMNFQPSTSESSVPQLNFAAAPPLIPTVTPSLDTHPEQQELNPPHVGSAATVDSWDTHDQAQAQNRPHTLVPKSPPGSSAIWKKNPGFTYSRRPLWVHTKGRYVCVQCGYVVSNPSQMTQHVSSHHRAAEDAGSSAPST